MSYAKRCYAKDNAIRKECGWTGCAWVGINFVEPKDEAETEALEYVQKKTRNPNGSGGRISVHVYDLVDIVADLMSRGARAEYVHNYNHGLSPAQKKVLVELSEDVKDSAYQYHFSTLKALYRRGWITVNKGPRGIGLFIRLCKTGEKPKNGHLLR